MYVVQPQKCCNVIVTAFILHNICINHHLPEPELLEDEDNEDEEDGVGHDWYDMHEQDGEATRQTLIENRFH